MEGLPYMPHLDSAMHPEGEGGSCRKGANNSHAPSSDVNTGNPVLHTTNGSHQTEDVPTHPDPPDFDYPQYSLETTTAYEVPAPTTYESELPPLPSQEAWEAVAAAAQGSALDSEAEQHLSSGYGISDILDDALNDTQQHAHQGDSEEEEAQNYALGLAAAAAAASTDAPLSAGSQGSANKQAGKSKRKPRNSSMSIRGTALGLNIPLSQPSPLGPVIESGQEATGRWTKQEHEAFLAGLKLYGKEWKKVAAKVKTRTVVQTRTHAQKYFQKLQKAAESGEIDPAIMTDLSGLSKIAPKSKGRKKIPGKKDMGQIAAQIAAHAQAQAQQHQNSSVDMDSSAYEDMSHSGADAAAASATLEDMQYQQQSAEEYLEEQITPQATFPHPSSASQYEVVLSQPPLPISHLEHDSPQQIEHVPAQPLSGESVPQALSFPARIAANQALDALGTDRYGGLVMSTDYSMKIDAPTPDQYGKRGLPPPSPAACGKRKLAELAAAQMLAGVMRRPGPGTMPPTPVPTPQTGNGSQERLVFNYYCIFFLCTLDSKADLIFSNFFSYSEKSAGRSTPPPHTPVYAPSGEDLQKTPLPLKTAIERVHKSSFATPKASPFPITANTRFAPSLQIVNPESLGGGRAVKLDRGQASPMTPWDGQLRALVR